MIDGRYEDQDLGDIHAREEYRAGFEAGSKMKDVQWIDPCKEMPEFDIPIVGKFLKAGKTLTMDCVYMNGHNPYADEDFQYFEGIVNIYNIEYFIGWVPR